MNLEITEWFDLLTALAADETVPVQSAYRQLREGLEYACRTQMAESSLQMTDLSARISFVASKVGLSVGEQNRLHTVRLTSNDVLNHRLLPSREHLLRDIKTLAFFFRKLMDVEIPVKLYRLLPAADATYRVHDLADNYVRRMRVCFQYADETFLYVYPTETISDELLKVRYHVPTVNEEFAETCRLLWKNAQVNLLDVVMDAAGVLVPSFIILEPDYLIDISSLAECFREYGHHPANYILSRLQLSENTRPLLLGNIANLFLDEWIYAKGTPDYLACMQKAFRKYPIELAACAELRNQQKERDFFEDCKRHFEHIRQTVVRTFREAGYDLDKEDAVLEPSYICEALGLQGRLDYMQRDMTSFIEMKSGRADEYLIRGKIEPKENNKVQMLLYQAVLEYSMAKDHRQVKAYLFYTRYPLLYPSRPSWAMLRRVMDVRNRIVANEYGIQLRNSPYYTAERLKEINPQVLNERGLDNVLWNKYLYPQIAALNTQIESLSSLEQSYFYTLYNFITKELYTSKSGDIDYDGRAGASALWLSTLDEKCEAGEILFNLKLVDNRAADVNHPFVQLEFPDGMSEDILPNFRTGDAIVLYQQNTETDNVTNQLVFKGSVEWITDCSVGVRLRAAQRNVAVLPETSCYAIEHDYMDTAFRSMYQGLAAFLTALPQRRDLLLGQKQPSYDVSMKTAVLAETDDFARVALKAKAAEDFFLLVGPPGTGKTSRALRRMVEEFYGEGKQLLLLSYTNRAVDEICKMLAAISPAVDFIRMGSELSCEEVYRPHLVENVLAVCRNRREVQERIAACRIFVGTVSTLSSKMDIFRLKTFDVALIDEATQILEPQLLGLLSLRSPSGGNAIGKFVMIGDYKQLPAVILQSSEQSEVCDESLRSIGLCNLKDSLFERLYRSVRSYGSADGFNPFCDMLCRQGRMNVEVADFPNKAFYQGLLQPVGLPHQQGALSLSATLESNEYAPWLTRRVAFFPASAEAALQSSKTNRSEARIVAGLAAAVYRQYALQNDFCTGKTLGIIAPYRSQIALICREIRSLGIPALNEILVDTVERFQGSERDVIIYSFCANKVSQLRFLANLTEEDGVLIDRKLNVALTRARKQMFMTGVPQILNQNPIYAALLKSLDFF